MRSESYIGWPNLSSNKPIKNWMVRGWKFSTALFWEEKHKMKKKTWEKIKEVTHSMPIKWDSFRCQRISLQFSTVSIQQISLRVFAMTYMMMLLWPPMNFIVAYDGWAEEEPAVDSAIALHLIPILISWWLQLMLFFLTAAFQRYCSQVCCQWWATRSCDISWFWWRTTRSCCIRWCRVCNSSCQACWQWWAISSGCLWC